MRFSPMRADLLRTIGGVCLLALSGWRSRDAVAQVPLTLVLAHGASEDSPRHLAALNFADTVVRGSSGKIKIVVSHSGQSGDDAALLEKVRQGQIAITANSQGTTSHYVPELAAFGLPYLFRSEYEAWSLLSGQIGSELAKRAEAKGLVVLGWWDNGFRHVTNSKRPIRVPKDFDGLVIRSPNDLVTVDFLESMGATAKVLPFGEVKAALSSRSIDGQENSLINIYTAGLHEVQLYLSLTNHKYECTPLMMSLQVWEQLSSGDRLVIRKAAADSTVYQRSLMRKSDERTLGRLAAYGVKINNIFSPEEFTKRSESVIRKWVQSDIGAFVHQVIQAVERRRGSIGRIENLK